MSQRWIHIINEIVYFGEQWLRVRQDDCRHDQPHNKDSLEIDDSKEVGTGAHVAVFVPLPGKSSILSQLRQIHLRLRCHISRC